MRAVVLTIGSPPYHTSKYLVKIIQPIMWGNKDQNNSENGHFLRSDITQ